MISLYMALEFRLRHEGLPTFFDALPRGSMRLELMLEPLVPAVVQTITRVAVVKRTAIWMKVVEDVLPSLCQHPSDGMNILTYFQPALVCMDKIIKQSGHSKNSFPRASLGNGGTLIAVFIDDAAKEVCEATSSSSSTLSEF
jgi:hypothetical protein